MASFDCWMNHFMPAVHGVEHLRAKDLVLFPQGRSIKKNAVPPFAASVCPAATSWPFFFETRPSSTALHEQRSSHSTCPFYRLVRCFPSFKPTAWNYLFLVAPHFQASLPQTQVISALMTAMNPPEPPCTRLSLTAPDTNSVPTTMEEAVGLHPCFAVEERLTRFAPECRRSLL